MIVTRGKVSRLVRYWRATLGIDALYKVDFRIHVAENDEKDLEYRDAIAYIQVEDGYFSANLTVNAWHIKDDPQLEDTIVHELVHIVLHPLEDAVRATYGMRLADRARAANESTVERISRSLLKLKRKRR